MDGMRRGGWILLLTIVGVLVIVLGARDRSADDDPAPTSTTQTQAVPDRQGLPAEAFETIALIRAGGPFPYSRDGVVFMNREGLLPEHERGYWHEYTVPTPGESDRGARRIIAGRGGELYYTADHYRSFVRVKEPR
ncbi:ribonuclease domain-containing protein [Aeromicrobium sp. Root236]|uniref:ribonuclease domain-containing protein n=1 Tax=Aeromicrobium sp. Root236 TaxID=1736498 RepID=UPI0009EBD19A|nr:ribonuclease domain-containing protein [Aeromicrobium sp. Root236]